MSSAVRRVKTPGYTKYILEPRFGPSYVVRTVDPGCRCSTKSNSSHFHFYMYDPVRDMWGEFNRPAVYLTLSAFDNLVVADSNDYQTEPFMPKNFRGLGPSYIGRDYTHLPTIFIGAPPGTLYRVKFAENLYETCMAFGHDTIRAQVETWCIVAKRRGMPRDMRRLVIETLFGMIIRDYDNSPHAQTTVTPVTSDMFCVHSNMTHYVPCPLFDE